MNKSLKNRIISDKLTFKKQQQIRVSKNYYTVQKNGTKIVVYLIIKQLNKNHEKIICISCCSVIIVCDFL